MKYRLYAAMVACLVLAGFASPAAGRDAERRPERTERTIRETPYSNSSVRREREFRRIAREIERDRQPSYYVFKRDRSPRD